MSKHPHGYFLAVNAIPALQESADELEAFQGLYIKRFEPEDPVQLFLVEMMYESHLNLRRVARWKAGAMESLARECWHRANLENAMTDGSCVDFRDSDPKGNDLLAGSAMIGAVHNGDILEKAIRLEQRTLINFCKAWDQLQKIRLQDNTSFRWPDRKPPQQELAPTGS